MLGYSSRSSRAVNNHLLSAVISDNGKYGDEMPRGEAGGDGVMASSCNKNGEWLMPYRKYRAICISDITDNQGIKTSSWISTG